MPACVARKSSIVPLVCPAKKSPAPSALPGAPLLSSYTTSQVGCETEILLASTAKPAVCGEGMVILPVVPTVEPERLTPDVALVLELSVMDVELAVVEAEPPPRDALMPQPTSAPTISPATKIPTYMPAFDVVSADAAAFEAAGLAAGAAVVAGADFAPAAGCAGCDHDNEGF